MGNELVLCTTATGTGAMSTFCIWRYISDGIVSEEVDGLGDGDAEEEDGDDEDEGLCGCDRRVDSG